MHQTCAKLKNKIETAPNSYRYSFYRSIAAAGKDWDMAAPAQDLFLQREYLQIVENAPPVGMRFGYLVFYDKEQPIGVAYCQINYFKGDDNIQELENNQKDGGVMSCISQNLKRWVAGKLASDILICGNMLLTGEHGYFFDEQKISPNDFAPLLEKALVDAIKQMEQNGIKMPAIFVKDLSPLNRGTMGKQLEEKGFVEFEIQPNMVMQLHWKTFEEYLAAMSTKYRTRAKRSFKKLDVIQKRLLTLTDMQQELQKMYELYNEIAKGAGFNMIKLNELYLSALKRDLPDKFSATGYYHNGRLIGYYTTILNGKELEAHFLGFEKSYNHDYQLYQNILYDIVREGIEKGCHQIVFARTALEIKSSVGAVPANLYCYLRHQNSLTNKLTGTVLDYVKPVEVWLQRHPFKKEEE